MRKMAVHNGSSFASSIVPINLLGARDWTLRDWERTFGVEEPL